MQLTKYEKTLVRCANIELLVGLRLEFYAAPSGQNLHIQSSRTVFEQQAVIERAEKDGVYVMLCRIRHDFQLLWQHLTEHEQTFVDFFYWQGRTIEGANDQQMYYWRKKIIKKVKPWLLAIAGQFAYYDNYQTEFERLKEEQEGVQYDKENRYNSKFAAVSRQRFDELDREQSAGVSSCGDNGERQRGCEADERA